MKDERGLALRLDPLDRVHGRDARELVRRGNVARARFGLKTIKDRWVTEGGLVSRDLLDIEIAEITLTASPAYQTTDVAVAQRSLRTFPAGARPIDCMAQDEAYCLGA